MNLPQAFVSSYAPRLRTYGNALIAPIIPQTQLPPAPRLTKRGTTAINYAEDGFDDDDFEDSEGPRRPTGLRSLRRDDSGIEKRAAASQHGKELNAPIEIQGIWRDWMGRPKRILYDGTEVCVIDRLKQTRTEKQLYLQAVLPLTLIPIRIDLDIQPFRPEPALPPPPNRPDVIENDPAYKHPDVTPTFRLKDTFLWNLHEGLMTPDHFAKTMVDELDLPVDRKPKLIMEISNQIRQQLEEYAGVALHPIFHSNTTPAAAQAPATQPATNGASRDQSSTPAPAGTMTPATPAANGAPEANGVPETNDTSTQVTATATLTDDVHNPDDAYRCIINLNINLMNRLYTDKFEWSLLHPAGFPEMFARQTCADLGLSAEWVPAVAHAIYEAVLRLKKEVCENGGLVGYGDIDNDAAEGVEAGWRYEPERLAADWEPTVEILSKEEIERREGDRERQIRRLRRETARFSSTANMPQNDFYANIESQDQPMGRGERSKKKRRWRSLSPLGRETPDTSGYGGGGGLQDWFVKNSARVIGFKMFGANAHARERNKWKCSHCKVWGSAVWAVRDGPAGPRSLCSNCGMLYERKQVLPPWSEGLFEKEAPYGAW